MDGDSATAQFNYSGGIAIDAFGDIFVADTFNETIRELSPSGSGWVVSTLGGYPTLFGSADGFGSAARFNGPNGIAVDQQGRLFVADFGNDTIREGMPFAILTATVRDANGFHFRQIGPPGRFIFQASADLNTWIPLASNTVSGAATLYINDPNASAVGHTFYRSVTAP
jgi:DNA-binding beta-propeller fold protein YncE